MPISKPELRRLLIDRYDTYPLPTPGEQRRHELMIDSGTYLLEQEKTDILHLALAGYHGADAETIAVALDRWNQLFPEDRYTSITHLIGVELGQEYLKSNT